MKNKVIKWTAAALLMAVILCAGAFGLLKFRGMYLSVHGNINTTRTELEASILQLDNKINALEAQVRLSNPQVLEKFPLNYDWIRDNVLIAHGMGGLDLDGHMYEYTNSLEAFQSSYEKGIRVFEADLQLSSDGALVVVHDWDRYLQEGPMSFADFQQAGFYDGRITQLTGSDIIDLLAEHPDIYIVTDSKYTDLNSYRLQFSQLVYLAQQKGVPEVLDRVIVQIYNQGMYDFLYEIYPWKSVIYTLYQSPDSLEEAVEFCVARGIQVITMGHAAAGEKNVQMLKDAGITTFVFTVNDLEEVNRCREIGVAGFYTDTLSPADLG